MREPTIAVPSTVWRRHGTTEGQRIIPEETAVALSYDGGTYAVMMATPQDLEDFAVGFSITEGVASSPADIRQLEIVEHDAGIELRMWLAEPHARALSERRRHLAGPTGCGLCGIDSLGEAVRPAPRVGEGQAFTPAEIMQALEACRPARSSTVKPARCMRRRSGDGAAASLPYARTSGGTMRSTSSPARWRARAWPARAAWCC